LPRVQINYIFNIFYIVFILQYQKVQNNWQIV
jgi:hypothetical protein